MAGRGKGALRIAIEDFLETFELGEILFNWQAQVLERFEDAAIDVYSKTVSTFYKGADLPPSFQPDAFGAIVKSSQNGFFVWIMGMLGLVFGGFFGLGQPSGRAASYFMDAQLRTFRGNPLELAAMEFREFIDSDIVDQYLNDLGVPNDLKAGYRELSRPLLTAFEYQVLWRREKLNDLEFDGALKRLGMSPDTIGAVKALGEIIPGPQDLVQMAVREAFDDELSAQFQHDEGFPEAFGLWAERQGLSDEWSRRYWRAHWQFPSPNQVFEMVHRLRPGTTSVPTTQSDVDQYLKIADYSPFWRQRLSEISYNPFTRVDVRRMYKVGVLDEAQVKEAYLDLGYNDERAQALTEFTIAYEAEEETGVVRSSVTSAYRDGFIDRATAESMLSAGGYDATTSGFYLDSIDFQNSLEVQSIKLRNIQSRYVEGVIDETNVNTELGLLNLPAEKTNALLELWTTQRENKTALPTTSQAEKFYEMGIITQTEFEKIFVLRGYTLETIEWTLERIDLEAQESAVKEVERAEKEKERLNKSKTSSVYNKNRADLDLEIAQAKAKLTDIAVALHGDVDEFQAQALLDTQDQLKQYIAAVNVRKAQLKQELTGTRLKGE